MMILNLKFTVITKAILGNYGNKTTTKSQAFFSFMQLVSSGLMGALLFGVLGNQANTNSIVIQVFIITVNRGKGTWKIANGGSIILLCS